MNSSVSLLCVTVLLMAAVSCVSGQCSTKKDCMECNELAGCAWCSSPQSTSSCVDAATVGGICNRPATADTPADRSVCLSSH